MKLQLTGKLHSIARDFLTNKREKKHHGIGLKSVKGIVKKYDGQMTVYTQKSEFCIKVLIYMDSQL